MKVSSRHIYQLLRSITFTDMDFQAATQTAQKWVTASKGPFEIIDIDVDGKRIIFASTTNNDTFYIVGPDNQNGNNSWHLWSDNDDVLTKLHPVIDSLQSCKETSLTEILNKTSKILAVSVDDAEDDDADAIEADFEDDDVYGNSYYDEEDPDVLHDTDTKASNEDLEENDMYAKQGSPTAVKRLLKDWKNVKTAEKFGIYACPSGSNLFVWEVKLKDIPKDTILGKDLQEYSKKYNREAAIHMEMTFPGEYPMAPPFVRIIQPQFQFLTGHVTLGGSICMELLTKSGWRPTYDIENLLIQIRSEILSDPNASLKKSSADKPYDLVEAQRAFERMVNRYGWNK